MINNKTLKPLNSSQNGQDLFIFLSNYINYLNQSQIVFKKKQIGSLKTDWSLFGTYQTQTPKMKTRTKKFLLSIGPEISRSPTYFTQCFQFQEFTNREHIKPSTAKLQESLVFKEINFKSRRPFLQCQSRTDSYKFNLFQKLKRCAEQQFAVSLSKFHPLSFQQKNIKSFSIRN
ncbi:hypothetical protein ABPG72_007579 [Tetrahymena utriculariae]